MIPNDTCIYMHVHVYTCIYMYIHVYTCIYMYIHVYTCICWRPSCGVTLSFATKTSKLAEAFVKKWKGGVQNSSASTIFWRMLQLICLFLLRNLVWPHNSASSVTWRPRELRTPKWSQNHPKMIPKWSQNDPKMILKWSQNDPNLIPKWSQK